MNCKQGDLAVFVRSTAGNEGRIVRCVRLIAHSGFLARDGSVIGGPTWEVDPPIFGWCGDRLSGVRDALLRPLRDGEGADETLTWVGRPREFASA